MRRPASPARRRCAAAGASALALALAGRPAGASAATADRVISVGGGLTEIVYAIGAERRLVATDSTSTWPEPAAGTPKVGYARSLAAEGLLSLSPDLLLASHEAGPPAALRQVEAAGVRVLRMPERHDLDGLIDRVERVGAALGHADAARALQARLRDDWERTRADVDRFRAGRARPVRAIFVLAHAGAPMVSGGGTAADAMIALAGAANPLRDAFVAYRPMTPEALIAADPEAILTTTEGLRAQGGIDGLLRRPGVAATRAGRARRVIELDALRLIGFGPRLPRTVTELARALHGTAA